MPGYLSMGIFQHPTEIANQPRIVIKSGCGSISWDSEEMEVFFYNVIENDHKHNAKFGKI